MFSRDCQRLSVKRPRHTSFPTKLFPHSLPRSFLFSSFTTAILDSSDRGKVFFYRVFLFVPLLLVRFVSPVTTRAAQHAAYLRTKACNVNNSLQPWQNYPFSDSLAEIFESFTHRTRIHRPMKTARNESLILVRSMLE